VASTVALLGVGLPLLVTDGLTGLAIGIVAGAVVQLAFRAWYLGQMFEGFMFFRHALRALLPVVPAIGVVLLIRLAETGPRTLAMAIGELVAFVLVVLGSTWLVEGPLVREAAGYVGRRAVVRAPVAG
jgi:CBS domain containing-hemolysin-like protein